MSGVLPPPSPDSDRCWAALCPEPLDVEAARRWLARPDCGAVVVFTGHTRRDSPGRQGVTALEFEAYDTYVLPRLLEVDALLRARFPDVVATVLWHRVGLVPLAQEAVVVGVASPHRGAAFAAASLGIDTLKATVPIWKREHHPEGVDWAATAQHVTHPVSEPGAPAPAPADESPGEDPRCRI